MRVPGFTANSPTFDVSTTRAGLTVGGGIKGAVPNTRSPGGPNISTWTLGQGITRSLISFFNTLTIGSPQYLRRPDVNLFWRHRQRHWRCGQRRRQTPLPLAVLRSFPAALPTGERLWTAELALLCDLFKPSQGRQQRGYDFGWGGNIFIIGTVLGAPLLATSYAFGTTGDVGNRYMKGHSAKGGAVV